ncbi:hypothetical protein GOP47_0021262 [Adiantum capillus-veneris]|uniref:Uncharacterized protein n=1 Tax=Adiantum capillus-veneris TaxID=13818 RepID=A0A9D4U9Z9_ADICA|nr:hypothetical protein GOP47_0020874 [Adiantum capillus-veneris]KAI5064592.1 hypothetical protein GOP47_0021262 [Adiantum capillus-veneris]
MVCLRSGQQTGDDREFHMCDVPLPLMGLAKLRHEAYMLRVKAYQGKGKKETPRYLAMVHAIVEFWGEGETRMMAIEDALLKLRIFIERQLSCNEEPRRVDEEDDGSGRYIYERVIDEGCPRMTWSGEVFDIAVNVHIQGGIVVLLEWHVTDEVLGYLWMNAIHLDMSFMEELNTKFNVLHSCEHEKYHSRAMGW